MKNKILIIEENEMMRLFLSNYLEKDFEIMSFNDLNQYFEDVRVIDKPDIILMNINKNTYEIFLSEVKNNLWIGKVPVFALCDEPDSNLRINALAKGVADCMSKPFNPSELTLRLKAVLLNTRTLRKSNSMVRQNIFA